jgi:multicomponent Na+:H+ antiporter subunit B
METTIDIVLLTFLCITAMAIIHIRKLFCGIMLLGIFSLLSACLFVTMDAVDVAFTEAAVGTGISTILLLGAMGQTHAHEKRPPYQPLLALLVVLVTGSVLIYGTMDLPAFGTPDAAIHLHVAPRYIQQSPIEVGPPNMVTSVLASYRGYDTLGETAVIFTAGIALVALLSAPYKKNERAVKNEQGSLATIQPATLHDHLILRIIGKMFIPFILLFALYVQFHGDYGPGGGFQAGVIFASGIILYSLIFGLDTAMRVISPTVLRLLGAAGLILYIGVGILCIINGGNFLDYNTLASRPVDGQHLGIFLIELGVGTTVFAIMVMMFYAFSYRGRQSS